MATAGCLAACLNTAGRGGMMAGVSRLTLAMVQAGTVNTIQAARIRKTREYFNDRENFMAKLAREILRFVKRAKRAGFIPAIRLNGTSDIPWERIPVCGAPNIMALFPTIQFYDYTKIAKRILLGGLPANYSLTFSLAENNDTAARAVLAMGGNVAVVFRDKRLPETYLGTRVVNGDESDLRFLDPAGAIIGLYAKGNAKHDTSGFVRDGAPVIAPLMLAA